MPWRLIAAVVIGLVVGVGVVLSFTDVFEKEAEPRPRLVAQATKGAPVSQEAAEILARKFRPGLRFDSAEPWRP